MSMRMKRYGDWIEYVTESGQTFYYNDKDGSFQWEHPLGQAYARPGAHPGPSRTSGDNSLDASEGIAAADAHYPWKAYLDPDSGSVFWYNELTHVSQWEMPAEFGMEGGHGHGAQAEEDRQTDARAAVAMQTAHAQPATAKAAAGKQTSGRPREGAAGATAAAAPAKSRRARNASFDEDNESAVEVWDHETGLGI
jgi:pyruvate/2-oxoglutarate dehydrogenase complex dihydrolipoamide acyltransferase (E2) component